jgi:hypothetical protein
MTYLEDDLSDKDGVSGEAGEASDGGSDDQNNSGEGNDNDQPTFDASTITPEQMKELLAREDLRETVLSDEIISTEVQSKKDKEIAKEKRIAAAAQRKRDADATEQEAARKKAELIADGKGDELLTFETQRLEETQALTRSATKVAAIIEDVVRQQPEFRSLGEDKVDEIYSSVEKDGGNVVDFTLALAKAKRDADVAAATKTATETVAQTVKDEIEAALVAAGVKERSDTVAEGDAPSKTITEGQAPVTNKKPTTWEEISLGYGQGTVSQARYDAAKAKRDEEEQLRY